MMKVFRLCQELQITEDTWERLSKAKRIGIKINQDKPVERWVPRGTATAVSQ